MKTHVTRGVLTITLLMMPGMATAQHFPSDAELTDLIRTRVEEGRATGIVLGVLEADGSRRVVSYGDAGPRALPLGEMSVFEIGSISKAFTGILLADMVSRGEVALDDPVADYLPDGVTVPSRGREITLVDLATHHSGLPRLPTDMTPADATNPYADYTVEQLYGFLSGYSLPRDVGVQFEYSNLGGGLLGHALSRAAGLSYQELARERILHPLAMDMTGITLDDDMSGWMTRGHDQQGNVVPLWDLPTLAGAGALRSNMRDMLTFLDANVGPPTSDLERAMRTSHEPREEAGGPGMRIGLHWIVQNVRDDRIVWHNGGTGGFRTFIGFDPDDQVGVVVLTNSTHGADDIGMHLINPIVPLTPAPAPVAERTAIELPVEVLERYVGVYQLAPTFSIAITLDDGALFGQATGQQRLPIFPEAETDFFLRVVDAQITFDVGADGSVTGMVFHQNGQSVPGRKVE